MTACYFLFIIIFCEKKLCVMCNYGAQKIDFHKIIKFCYTKIDFDRYAMKKISDWND